MVTRVLQLFLASSSELEEDRQAFEISISRKNSSWINRNVFIKVVKWEDFIDAVSQTRLQDEYNKAVKASDLFVMLFANKVGKYTREEFEMAVGQFKQTKKPLIFTYFRKIPDNPEGNKKDSESLRLFHNRLSALQHFPTEYKSAEDLMHKFYRQLDKLDEHKNWTRYAASSIGKQLRDYTKELAEASKQHIPAKPWEESDDTFSRQVMKELFGRAKLQVQGSVVLRPDSTPVKIVDMERFARAVAGHLRSLN